MREILFRGKTKGGVWVKGYYEKKPNGKTYILNRCKDAPDGDPMWEKVLIEHEVIEETVCQYTGLTDKNGKKIFEGDIVNVPFFTPSNMRVTFIEGAFCLANKEGEYVADIHYIHHAGIECAEVIGNIYDNPDIIGYKKGAGA